MRGVWKLDDVPVSQRARETAEKLNINLEDFRGEQLARIETALVKLNLRYCKKRKCKECQLEDFCKGLKTSQKER